MNGKIYVARHGQNKDNVDGILNGHRDLPLTELGVKQAKELALIIRELEIKFDHIFSSPLERAYETARIVAENLDIKDPIKTQLLIERDFGKMTGKPISEIKNLPAYSILETDTITYFLEAEDSESFPKLLNRANDFFNILESTKISGNILLVCHGDIGKMLYASFYKLEWLDVLKNFHFGNSELLLLDHNSHPEERHLVKMQQHNH